MEIELYLLRHGQSLRKKEGIWGRAYDSDLDPVFLHQLEHSKKILSVHAGQLLFRCRSLEPIIPGSLRIKKKNSSK
jgi:hypothetical protein